MLELAALAGAAGGLLLARGSRLLTPRQERDGSQSLSLDDLDALRRELVESVRQLTDSERDESDEGEVDYQELAARRRARADRRKRRRKPSSS